jgi:MinD superfamily P-loop ATPase containing an inserted ferredoxin domain
MKNRIYYFTGTGNSLNVAQNIAKALSDCELVAICKDTSIEISAVYERIGSVYPNYAGGRPKMVADFINAIKLPDIYLFVVATYGGFSGSVLARAEQLIQQKGRSFNYGAVIRSYPNMVTAYPMIRGVGLFVKMNDRKSKRVAKEIATMTQKPISAVVPKKGIYDDFMVQIYDSDKEFYVNDDCISCEICRKVCPANNITMSNGKPTFNHQCESCMACIQYCPKRAINDKNKTEKRGRYTNPHISAQTIIKLQKEVK